MHSIVTAAEPLAQPDYARSRIRRMSFGQGGPSWGPGDSRTPDWAALAEASAARGRRRKWLFIGGGALATAAVAAIVATAVITTDGGGGASGPQKNASGLPAPADLPPES